MEAVMDPYDVLGVPSSATFSQIKAAWRRKASSLHPDRSDGDDEKMTAVNRAYKVLSDPEQRAFYDQTGQIHNAKHSRNQRITNIFAEVVTACVQRPGNILVHVRNELQRAIDEGTGIIAKFQGDLDMNRKRLLQISGPNAGDPSLLTDVIGSFIKKGEASLAKALAELSALEGAIELLDGYTSSEEDPVIKSKDDIMMDMLSGMFGERRR